MNNSYFSGIWKRILMGEEDALEILFKEFYNPLINYGLKLHPEKAFIKDCAQDVFLNIWNHRENLSQVDNVRSYLYTALRMRIIELNRQNNARAKRQQNYAEYSIDGLLNIEEVNIRGETDKIKKRALKNAVKRLSDRQREVVYLKFYEGFTNDEIAGVMEIKKQSVYNLIFESLRKLEEYLNYI